MVGVVVAILVSAAAIKGGDTNGTDEFIARQAWLYVAIVAGAYFISRGLAKSGSSDPYTESRDDGDRNGRSAAGNEQGLSNQRAARTHPGRGSTRASAGSCSRNREQHERHR